MSLPSVLQNPAHKEAIALSLTYGVVPYEAPIDCQLRLTSQGRIQQCGNIVWFVDDLVLRTLKLRKFLTDSATSPDPQFFRQVIADKIKVKTYLTDRVLTGEHKTNREKRWETHPNSVHFAERRTCMAIEYILVTQLCAFDGFPQAALDRLNAAKLLPSSLLRALCPITGKALSYEGLRDELLNPTHGKSNYQVGHLNPLKCEPEDGKSSGHTADNIGWISADGNRIQGSLALEDVRLLVKRIAENYARYGW